MARTFLHRVVYPAAFVVAVAVVVGGAAWGVYEAWIAQRSLPTVAQDYQPGVRAMIDAGRLDEAVTQLRLAGDMDINFRAGVLPILYDLARQAGDEENQLHALRLLVLQHPDDPQWTGRLAWWLATQDHQQPGDAALALSLAQRTASEVNDADAQAVIQAHRTLAAAYANSGRHDEAMKVCDALIVRLRAEPRLAAVLAQVRSERQRYERGEVLRREKDKADSR